MLFERYGDHRDLHVLTHSFPTRRSSDLFQQFLRTPRAIVTFILGSGLILGIYSLRVGGDFMHGRSEEHTSELPSLMRISYAVFCLKKKTTPHTTTSHTLPSQLNTQRNTPRHILIYSLPSCFFSNP